MVYCFTFIDESGRVTWMGGVDCATDVSAVIKAARSLRARERAAVVEISKEQRLLSRVTRAQIARRPKLS